MSSFSFSNLKNAWTKRPRWLKITLISTVSVLFLLLLTPTLISWFGKGFILGKVNSKIMGRIEADSISLGWFSGAKIYGVKLIGTDNQTVASVPAVTTGLTVFGALKSTMDLGTMHAQVDALNIEMHEDGTNSLTAALAPRVPPDPHAPASPPMLIKMHFLGKVNTLTVKDPDNPTIVANDSDIDLLLDTTGVSPLVLTFGSTVKVGGAAATPIKASANMALFSQGNVRGIGALVGKASIDLGTQDAAVAAPLFKKLGFGMKEGGTLKCETISFDAPSPGTGAVQVVITIDGTATTAEGDVPLKNAQLALKANIEGNALRLLPGCGVHSDFLKLDLGADSLVSAEKLDIHGTLSYALNKIVQLVETKLPAGTTIHGTEKTTAFYIHGTPTLKGFVLDAQPDTSLMFDQIANTTYGIDAKAGKIGLSLMDGKLSLTTNDVAANQGTLKVIGYLDLEKKAFVIPKPVQLVVDLQINGAMGNNLLAWMPITWGAKQDAALSVKGKIAVRIDEAFIPLDYKEFLKSGTVKGALRIDDFATDSPLFGDMTKMIPIPNFKLPDFGLGKLNQVPECTFNIKDGKASYENLVISMEPVMSVAFSGNVGLDFSSDAGVPVNMTMALRPSVSPVAVGFKMSGTTKNYKLEVDPASLTKMTQSIGPDAIKGVQKGLENGVKDALKGFKLPGQK